MGKLFIFDMGEVLVLNVKNLQAIARRFRIEYSLFRSDYALYDKPLMEGFMAPMDFFLHMEKHYGLEKIEENLFVTDFSPVANRFILDHIDALRRNGHRCVLGSNTFPPHMKVVSEMEEKPLSHLDKLYESYRMHISKPSLAFWKRIMEEEGYSPFDTIFVDDREDNIKAAESLGITCFKYSSLDNGSAMEFFLRYEV
ncbi:MAG: HAD-IA family hydrolase [Candidatus Ornithospirochaeta sp.]